MTGLASPRRYLPLLPLAATPLAILGYAGNPLLATIPVGVAVVLWITTPHPAGERLRSTFVLLGLLYAATAGSAALHPGPATAQVLQSTAACCALAMLLALAPRAPGLLLGLVVASGGAAVLLALAALADPAVATAKSPILRLLLPMVGVRGPAIAGGSFLHPNLAGVLAGSVAPAWLAAALVWKPRWARLIALGAGLGMLGVLLTSGSRGGILAVASGLLVLAALRSRRPVAAGVLAVAALGLALTLALPIASLTPDAVSRTATWEGTIQGILASPLTGRGIGSFPIAYVGMPASAGPVGPHDTLLFVWLDLGLPGLILVLALSAMAFARSAFDGSASGQMLLAGLVAWFVHSVVESTIIVSYPSIGWHEPGERWHEVVLPLAFAIWGLAAASPGPWRWLPATDPGSATGSIPSASPAGGNP